MKNLIAGLLVASMAALGPASATTASAAPVHFAKHHMGGAMPHRMHHHRGFADFDFFVGVPDIYSSYDGYGACHWLKQKALHTDSAYWWHRYEVCRYG